MRKPNNPLKRKIIQTRIAFKDLAIAMVCTNNACDVVNYKTGRLVPVTKDVIECVGGIAWPWAVELSVLCRDQMGREYVVSEPIQLKAAYRHSDQRFLDWLNEEHKAFIAKQNPMHVICPAWLAIPDNRQQVETETLYNIYKTLGGFDNLSKFEAVKAA